MLANAPDVLKSDPKAPLYEMEISGTPYYFSFVHLKLPPIYFIFIVDSQKTSK